MKSAPVASPESDEIDVLNVISQHLRISVADEDLGQLAIQWMARRIPARAFAVQYLPVAGDRESAFRYKARTRSTLLTSGGFPLDNRQFTQLVRPLKLVAGSKPFVFDSSAEEFSEWPFPEVRQGMVAPLWEGSRVFGYLAAVNHVDDQPFQAHAAKFLVTLGTLLGIHCGNRELYRQQADLLANVVRALVSAIDAKDPYTCGHSDRVARVAVRIALEMRCSPKLLSTIYMSGLLHDVGKIGIDDQVLRKPGRLSDAEYEHIKIHPEMGQRILGDLTPLADVLPGVLHHHEQWNGEGYPHRLASNDIPEIARILAVADAYDAMTSDRPYRKGMPLEKVDAILRDGAGKHWDPAVIGAYFRVKEDIADICSQDRAQRTPNQPEWI